MVRFRRFTVLFAVARATGWVSQWRESVSESSLPPRIRQAPAHCTRMHTDAHMRSAAARLRDLIRRPAAKPFATWLRASVRPRVPERA